MSYTNYVSGVQKGTIGQPNAEYSLLVSGNTDYTGASGVMIKSDTTLSTSGNRGTRIYQNSDDNAFIDFRTTATDGAKSIAVRLQDDASPSTFNNMLTLNKDTVTDTSVYGATVGGRVKASQYYVSQADNRTPNQPGVYIGMDSSTVGFFKINKGTGTGGFTFNTYNTDGTIYKNNMNLNANGTVQMPYYQSSGNTEDSETTAIASFDANGNLLRDYNQNKRMRSFESRMAAVEGNSTSIMPTKMNEIIGRLNGLKYWSSDIQTVTITSPTTAPTTAPTAAPPTESLVLANLPLTSPADYYATIGIYNDTAYTQIGGKLFKFPLSSPASVVRASTSELMYHGDYTNYGFGGTSSNLLIDTNTGMAYAFVNGSSVARINLIDGTGSNPAGMNALNKGYGLAIYGSTMYMALDTEVKTTPLSSIFDASMTTLLTGLPSGSAKRITVDGTYFYICDTGAANTIKQYRLSDNSFVQNMATAPDVIRWMRYKNGYVYYSLNRYVYRVNVSSKVVQVLSDHPGLCVPTFDFDSAGNLYYFTQNTGIGNNFYVNDPPFYKVTNL